MTENKGKSFEFIKKLNTMLCAKMSIWVVSTEEEKFLRVFRKIATTHQIDDERFGIYSWSITEGLLDITPSMIKKNNVYRKPIQVLEATFGPKTSPSTEPIPIVTFSETYDFIMQHCSKKMFIIKDIHNLLDKNRSEYPAMVRRMRDLIYHTRINDADLIFLSPVNRIPIDIETDIQVLDMPRPDEYDIESLLNIAFGEMQSEEPSLHFDIDFTNQKGQTVKSTHPKAHSLKEKVIMNLRGLTESEISQILKFICVKNHGIDEKSITEIKDAKKQIIEKNGVLSIISTTQEVKVGGHDEFKKYIDSRGLYLDNNKRKQFNLTAPKGVLLVGVPGCQPANSKVLMSNGKWKNIQDIKLGDEILSPQDDGTVLKANVINLIEYKNKHIYKIKNKIDEYECSDDHIITIYAPDYKKKRKWIFQDVTLKEFINLPKWRKVKSKISYTPAYELPTNLNQKINPYLFGVLVGDGSIYKSKNTIGICITYAPENQAIIDRISEYCILNKKILKSDKKTLSIYISRKCETFTHIKNMYPIGINSHAKFIPEEYKLGSIKQRLELLAGLIDTDGSIDSFSSVSLQLIKDFSDLVRSVGGYCSNAKERFTKVNKNSDKYFKSYRVHFSFAEYRPTLSLINKNQNILNMKWKNPRNHAIKVIKTNKIETVYGFQLDSPSQRYITDNYIITHNCGKSLNAKYIGYKWNIPLIRLNMDAIFAKYLGESEDNLRTALSIAEATAPCILWLEEIEKALGGISNSGDSGTGMRILGKILTWMQEREEMVFLFATANSVSNLPPELLRAGRVDAKFWADLPNLEECRDIFEIKIKENGFELSDVEYTNLAMLAHQKSMTGAEIEHCIIQGLYFAASDEYSDKIQLSHIQEAIHSVNSHAETHQENLDKERIMALKNYIFTSNATKRELEKRLKSP